MKSMAMTGHQYIWNGAIAAIGGAAVVIAAAAAQAAPLEQFRYDAASNQLTFVLPDGVEPRYFLMAQPARIVVDIPDTQVEDLPVEQTFSGAVRRIEVSQVQPQLARVVLEMSPQAVFARGQVSLQNVGDAAAGKDRWIVQPLLAGELPAVPSASAPSSDVRPSVPDAQAASPTELAPQTASTPTVEALPERSALPPMTPPAATVPTTSLSEAPAVSSPLARSQGSLPVKPAPAVELPPGMEAVVATPPLPQTPVNTQPASPVASLPDRSNAPTGPVTAALPVMGESPAINIPVAQIPVEQSADAPDDVPLMQLPPESPAARQAAANVPPPPPLFQAGIINQSPVTAVPNPNSPAALVTPQPVIRPDLRSPGQRSAPSQPTVSVPPLSSLAISSGNASPVSPSVPPLPTTSIAQAVDSSANNPPPAASVTVPTNQSGAFPPAAQPATSPDLPPLPQISPRADVNDRAPTAVVPTSPLFNAIPTTTLPTAAAAGAVVPVRSVRTMPSTGVVEFGQQLPGATVPTMPALPLGQTMPPPSTLPQGPTVVALDNLTTGGVVVPAGTLLSLRYDQEQVLKLNPGQRQQSILRLQSPIVDARGQVIVASGALVLGEFATNQDGSQFTTQSLATFNRNLPFMAQSDTLKSAKRISNNQLLQNSGIGAVAGAILGGLNASVLGGAAAGAAITYATSPKETTVQPGQVVEVKLMQDFFSAR